MSSIVGDMLSAVHSVTKEWTKQRKAEEKGLRSRSSRQYVYSDRVNCTDVDDKIMPGRVRARRPAPGRPLPATFQAAIFLCRPRTIPASHRPAA